MKTTLKIALMMSAVVLILTSSWTLFAQTETINVYEKLKPFFEALYFIENEYYEKDTIDYDKLIDQSIIGLLAGLEDRYSGYLNKSDVAESRIQEDGVYGGLGIEVTYNAHYKAVEVVAPMFGTPAYRAGLKAKDLIMTIDGVSVETMTYMEAVNNLRGVPGTIVTIEVFREGVGKLEFQIEREQIRMAMVQIAEIDYQGSKMGYIRINQFSRPTQTELRQALNTFYDSGADGLIMDLRNNPGGLLTQSIQVASMFLDAGEIVVTTRSTDGFVNTYRSLGNDFPDLPMVVLINQGSASASEILAGALRDHGRAILLGEKTFGKAAIQTVFPLSNGGELILTSSHYYTPLGKDIHMVGIEPDILVPYKPAETEEPEPYEESDSTLFEVKVNTERDNQLKMAVEILFESL